MNHDFLLTTSIDLLTQRFGCCRQTSSGILEQLVLLLEEEKELVSQKFLMKAADSSLNVG